MIIKKWIPEHEQDMLFNHTRRLREQGGREENHDDRWHNENPNPGDKVEIKRILRKARVV